MIIGAKRIVVVFLIYGRAHLDEGIAQINQILGRMFPDSAVQTIVVDNKLEAGFESGTDAVREISGDNSLGEFSGWDHGYAYARRTLGLNSDDLVFFANDTFFRRSYRDGGNGFLEFFDRQLVEGHDLTRECVGYLDDFPRDVELMDIRYRSWIRSNIFFIPFDICERLGKLSFPLPEEEIFSDDCQRFWSDTDKISDNWKAYIGSWLFGRQDPAYPEYRLNWHSACEVDADNMAMFRKKARAILSEHYLTARLHAMACPIVDANRYELLPDRHTTPYYS